MSRLSFELDSALLGQPWYTTGLASIGWIHRSGRNDALDQIRSGESEAYISIVIPYDDAYTQSGITC